MSKLKEIILVSRPICWPAFIFFYLIGFIMSSQTPNFLTIIGLLFVTFPLGYIIFGLNDYADFESDNLNPRKGFFKGGIVKSSQSTELIFIISLISILFIFFLIWHGIYFGIFVYSMILLFSYIYSLKPFRLKSIPILDCITDSFLFISVLYLGYAITNHIPNFLPNAVISLFIGVSCAHALYSLLDIETDKKMKDITTGVFLGTRITSIFVSTLLILIYYLLQPTKLILNLYLLFNGLMCLTIFIKPTKKVIKFAVWSFLWSFLILISYLFFFDINYTRDLLTLR